MTIHIQPVSMNKDDVPTIFFSLITEDKWIPGGLSGFTHTDAGETENTEIHHVIKEAVDILNANPKANTIEIDGNQFTLAIDQDGMIRGKLHL